MNVFVDTISSPAHIIFFDENKKILDDYSWEIKWKESSTLIPMIDRFLKKHNLAYEDLENIVVVNGPGSFTGVRTTVLVVNTINYIIKKNLVSLSYFDLFSDYPIIKSSSKRDCFIQFDHKSDIEIMKNDDILDRLWEARVKTIYWNADLSVLWDVEEKRSSQVKIVDKVYYQSIISEIDINVWEKNKKIEPLYIKKPNIS